VVLREGQVLLIRKARGPYAGLWDLPGGGIEFGESPEEAVLREFQEETGLAVVDLALCGTYYRQLARTLPGGEEEDLDSLGACWVPLQSIAAATLSPLAREGLRLL